MPRIARRSIETCYNFLTALIKEIKENANTTNKEIFECLEIGKNRISNLLKN